MEDNIKLHLENLSTLISQYNFIPANELWKDSYKLILKAALAKCFDFTIFLYSDKNPESSFFYSPFLRGICEDLISLKYIRDKFKEDSSKVILQYLPLLVFESLEAQMTFLNKAAPFQQSLGYQDIRQKVQQLEEQIKKTMTKTGLKGDKVFPSIRSMAQETGLIGLYEYIYHASSKMVHFSPHILARLGWYDSKDAPTVFSTKNFYKYYEQFNKFYSVYLLIQFCNTFKKDIGFKKDFKTEIRLIEDIMTADNVFYPELVTFEEMNLQRPPNSIFSMLPKIIREMSARERRKK